MPPRWIIAAALAGAIPAVAQGRPAECYVQVDGLVVIDGRCDFAALGDDGSFRLAAPKGGSSVEVAVTSAGLADGWWLDPRWATQAQSSLGRLARNDACWSNEAATICAW